MDYVISLLRALTGEALAPTTAAFALAAIGLNIHFGFTGLINMGQAAFLLVGAYGFAISLTSAPSGCCPSSSMTSNAFSIAGAV